MRSLEVDFTGSSFGDWPTFECLPHAIIKTTGSRFFGLQHGMEGPKLLNLPTLGLRMPTIGAGVSSQMSAGVK